MDKKKIIDMISTLALDYKALFNHTLEIKKVLSGDLNENIFEDPFIKRGLLLEKINSSTKYYASIKEFCSFTGNTKCNSEVNELLQQIKKELDATVVLNEEITSLIKQHINDIASSLTKIQEGRHFMGALNKHSSNTPPLIDIFG